MLDLFNKDELDSVFNQLVESELLIGTNTHSEVQLKNTFAKERIYDKSHYYSVHIMSRLAREPALTAGGGGG